MRGSPRTTFAGFACFALLFVACTQADDSAALPDGFEGGNQPATGDDGETQATPGAPSEGPVPNLDDLPGSIAVRDGDGQIVVVAPTGAEEMVLDDGGAEHSQPTWSSSGEQLAWSSVGSDGPLLTIADRNGATRNSLPVTAPAFYLSWSESDSAVGGLRPTPTGMEMFVVDEALTTEQFVSSSQPFYFEWNGDEIVAAVGGQILVDITIGDEIQRLARPLQAQLGAFQAPAILANRDVLVALNLDGVNTVSRITPTTIEPIATANAPLFLALSPDGRQLAVLVQPTRTQEAESQEIAFQFDEPIQLDTGRVTVIDLETGEVNELSDQRVVSISWSPNGETLAMLRATADGLEWRFLTNGETILGTSFTPSQRFSQSYLPFFDQYNLSSTPWSPDSTAVTFAGQVGDQTGVFVDRVDDEVGSARIASGDIAFWSPN